MNGIRGRDFRGADDGRDVEVAERGRGGPDAHRFIRKADVQRVRVCLGVNGDGGDPELATRSNDADGNLTAIGNQYFAKHLGEALSALLDLEQLLAELDALAAVDEDLEHG